MQLITKIAGFNHKKGAAELLASAVKTGMRLDLVPEPENEYDRFAVRIQLGDQLLGYVPRERSEAVSRLIGYGVEVTRRKSHHGFNSIELEWPDSEKDPLA
jgi:HIRAN domain-containing protein